MPKSSVEFAAQLYEEQEEALAKINGEDDATLDRIYDAQKRYDDVVRELAEKSEIVEAIPSFAGQGFNTYFQAAAWHIVYLSRNTDVLKRMLTLEYNLTKSEWTDHQSFHLLDDNTAEFVINYLKQIEITEERWLYIINNYIARNRLEQHLDLFIHDSKFRFPGTFTSVVNYFKTPENINIIKQLVEEKSDISVHARSLMLLQQPEAWEYAKTAEDIKSDYGDTLARYGAPADLDIFTRHIESATAGFKIKYLDRIVAFGNLRAIQWLYGELTDPDAEYRVAVFERLCDFFPEELTDYEEFAEINALYEHIDELKYEIDDWNLPEFEDVKLQTPWFNIQEKLVKIRDFGQRYDGAGEVDQVFDLLHILRYYRYTNRRSALNSLVNDLVVYTGQYFPFDHDAYMEKQDAQLDVWEKYLEDNREQFLPGRWVRWGKYIDE